MIFGLEEFVDGWEPHVRAPPEDVRSILCVPWYPGHLLEWAKANLDDSHNNRTVVFSGRETPLSAIWGWRDKARWKEMTRQYKKYFKRIYFYATDVALEGVKTMPLGFTEMYMQDRTDSFLDAWMQTSTNDTWKVHSILAAWGKYNKLEGGHMSPEENSPGGKGPLARAWTEIANHAIDIRNDAAAWAGTPEGMATGVQRRFINKEQWWIELSKYKFTIVPLGSAIQCSKLPEALSMLTIPVIKRGPFSTHDDLVRMGFPIVIVEAWVDITWESMKRWWRKISPMLLVFRESCLNTEGYWRLLTQGNCMPYDTVRILNSLPNTVNVPESDSNLTGTDITPAPVALEFEHGYMLRAAA
jgi:hypothetical protein